MALLEDHNLLQYSVHFIKFSYNLLKKLLVRNLNTLKELTEANRALIFDDIDWSKITREEKIHLIDKDYVSAIRVLYGCINLDPTLIKVITSNKSSDLINFWDLDEAIVRRIKHIQD
jgi:hypothetical protein